jgi:uncharacterized surface protein with fasciclin (FAS1) repeats
MHLTIKHLLVVVSVFTVSFLSCKKWDDRTGLNNPSLNETLLEQINKRANLAKFSEYLVKTGLDKEIASSKNYTVWAPTDASLQSLDPAIINDSAKLRQFIGNHISNLLYYSSMAQTTIRVPMLNGKRVSFLNNKFDEANITEADFTVGNGVLHILDKAASPLLNAWDFVNNTATQYKQSAFIVSQNFNGFDPSKAVVDSISATTGLPVYRPGTGIVPRNRFNDQVYDLKSEDKLYTFFVLNDAALTTEIDSLTGFYKTGTADSTYNLSAMSVLKDVVVEGLFTSDQLSAGLVSKSGIPVKVDRNDITETHRISNGIIYVLKKLDFPTRQKITDIIVQGESPRGFFRPTGESVDVRGTTFYRVRRDSTTGNMFNDIYLYNHGIALLNVQYQANNVPAAKYKVYWVAINDTIVVNTTINPATYTQRLAMGSSAATNFAYVTVPLNNRKEVLLGEYTHTAFGPLNLFLTAANTTVAATNRLTLDYIRLEPQF